MDCSRDKKLICIVGPMGGEKTDMIFS